jgi:hypothetical protein
LGRSIGVSTAYEIWRFNDEDGEMRIDYNSSSAEKMLAVVDADDISSSSSRKETASYNGCPSRSPCHDRKSTSRDTSPIADAAAAIAAAFWETARVHDFRSSMLRHPLPESCGEVAWRSPSSSKTDCR